MDNRTVLCPQCKNENFYSSSDQVIRCRSCGANIFLDRLPGSAQVPTTPEPPRPVINLSGDTDVLDSQAAEYELASKGQRFANYFVDRIASYFLLFLIIGISDTEANNSDFMVFFALLMIPGYYFILESINGKTLGKYLTGTRAVKEDGNSLGYGPAFFRTLCRLIPLEPFSIFFSNGICWHDSIPRTRVIKDR